MCLALFIAAETEPSLVPWVESSPAFNVVPLGDADTVVVKHMTKPYVRYAGAHTGCSCGFAHGLAADPSGDDDEARAARGSLRALQRYVRDLLERVDEVELYLCWEGDWEKPKTSVREVDIATVSVDRFELTERELLRVQRTGPPGLAAGGLRPPLKP